MKLEKFLLGCTPLPWLEDVPKKETAQVVRANAIYRKHVANTLPELVKAAKPFITSAELISPEQFIRLRNALAAAEEVRNA